MELMHRYERNKKTLSDDDQARLGQTTVAIVGCGGLGGYLAEEWARLGVGRLIIIDGDRIEETNLNRQIMATEENLGELKVEAARQRLQKVNSQVDIKVVAEWLDETNGPKMLQGANLVYDGLDSLNRRIILERVCHAAGIPLVYASIAGWFGLCGISYPGDFTVARLFGCGQRGVESTWGNPAFTPAVVASLAVAEGVKAITGRTVSLRHSFLQVDLLTMEFERVELT